MSANLAPYDLDRHLQVDNLGEQLSRNRVHLIMVDVRAAAEAAIAGSLMLATGCAGTHARPVFTTVPSTTPTAVTSSPCVVGAIPYSTRPGKALVSVDRHPVAVAAVWVPGLNQRPCRSQITNGKSAQADRLASAIDAAPRFPSGRIACPNDDGSGVVLYFSYSHSQPETATVTLRGCRSVQAPARRARQVTTAVYQALAPLMPVAWRQPEPK
jgi:hypothetical protein